MSETFVTHLNSALHELFEADTKLLLLGEDILDPYGGAFRVTKGLSTRFPDRVFTTPISESAITGIGIGLALQGYKPIVEIMFGDFTTLIVDQILNSASKIGLMYGGDITVPLVVRTPMGGGRGYGPTHSQSIEKLFFGMPGVSVVAPSICHDIKEELSASIDSEGVVIFIEDKKLYTQVPYSDGSDDLHISRFTIQGNRVVVVEAGPNITSDVTIIAYGGLSPDICRLIKDMREEEIYIRAVFPSVINDLQFISADTHTLFTSTQGIIIAEPGAGGFGWGSEVTCALFEQNIVTRSEKVLRLSAKNTIIPSAREKERDVLVSYEKLEQATLELMK